MRLVTASLQWQTYIFIEKLPLQSFFFLHGKYVARTKYQLQIIIYSAQIGWTRYVKYITP